VRGRNRWVARPRERFKKSAEVPIVGAWRMVGAELRPFMVGLGEDAGSRFKESGAGTVSMGLEMSGQEEVWGWGNWERRVFLVEEKSVEEKTEAS
jgi:hypothetical protein